jgi:hypothetical protein
VQETPLSIISMSEKTVPFYLTKTLSPLIAMKSVCEANLCHSDEGKTLEMSEHKLEGA